MQSLFEKEKSQTEVHSEVYIVTAKGAKWSARPRGARGALHELHGVHALCPTAAKKKQLRKHAYCTEVSFILRKHS